MAACIVRSRDSLVRGATRARRNEQVGDGDTCATQVSNSGKLLLCS